VDTLQIADIAATSQETPLMMPSASVPTFCSKCRFCHSPAEEAFFYCPVCGKKLKEPPVSTSVLMQILAYAISIFLPPLGLAYTFKYLRQGQAKARVIGWITLFLTIISCIVTIKLTLDMMSYLTSSINSQIPNYSNTGL
jgi:hypothetical protein